MIIHNYDEYISVIDSLDFGGLKKISNKEIEENLLNLIDKLREKKEVLANIETKETCKPIKYSLGEVERSIDLVRSFMSQLYFTNVESGNVYNSIGADWYTIRKPIGTIIGFMPFSSPFSSFLHKMIASLMYRNIFFAKPSMKTVECSTELYNVIMDSFDERLKKYVSIILIDDNNISSLLKDDRFDCILFTGSSETAKSIKASISRKRCVFETGSLAMTYIAESANIKQAVSELVTSSFSQSGFRCIATKNVFVNKNRYKEFVSELKNELCRVKVGDCFDENVDVSYIRFDDIRTKLKKNISDLKRNGYEVMCGGEFDNRNLLPPTVLIDLKNEYKALNELFGPVLCVHSVDDYHSISIEYIKRSSINTAIFSNDYSEINNCINENDYSGTVYVNHHTATRYDYLQFGGFYDENENKEGIKELAKLLSKEQLIIRF